ncbi:Piso0_004688 [Millerozyma farinosa CBS 7064]|uniref:Piso0_004688 protein n=1 Tax=Pichia sorbitophila (strain ATCC MYA-4447 / BCRC 22081 / CBS 7064 / NBRC 10061 / NRRL Y-12695) TaxID=559304 RepID=G8Y9H1_PICSO|nr:Piso0_004688 [Millerozyma farinosa CBS 7064]CCE85116.1 Piso0_004688 [Millerozyma farinosa CBS 7064]
MSSIVKKASLFTPKIKKTPIRRKNNEPDKKLRFSDSPVNEEGQDEHKRNNEDDLKNKNNEANIPTTSLDVVSVEQNRKPSLSQEDIDPKDTTKALPDNRFEDAINKDDEVEDEDLEDYNDIDIFKSPKAESSRRRSSVNSQRRLSSISLSTRKRSLSNSSQAGVPSSASATPEGNEASNAAPLKIGIPVLRPSKRRASTLDTKQSSRKPIPVGTPFQLEEKSEYKSGAYTDGKGPTGESTAKYVMGIDPKTNKLKKFRVYSSNGNGTPEIKEDVDSDDLDEFPNDEKNIPVAPDNLGTQITSVKQLPRTVNDTDISLLSQVGLDVGSITMADLCKPSLPIGAISENYKLVKEAQEKIRKAKLRKRVDRMRARAERRALEELTNGSGDEQEHKQAKSELLLDNEPEQTTRSGLKLAMQNGALVLDEDSTVVSRRKSLVSGNKSREESNPFENPITSSTYSKRKHTDRWTADELKQFYNALSTWGTDFTFIAQLFPYRTRKQIKSKFNLEEKKYPEVVEMALKRKLPPDFEKYCSTSKNKIETLEYYNEELRQLRIKHEQEMAQILEERQRAIKEDAEENRRREIELRTGSKPMSRAEKVRELRKNEMVLGSIDDVKKNRS